MAISPSAIVINKEGASAPPGGMPHYTPDHRRLFLKNSTSILLGVFLLNELPCFSRRVDQMNSNPGKILQIGEPAESNTNTMT
jgi:hypothetical protein